LAESKEERVSRELIELLNELRVALPGVQVLFAFLLVVPFSQRFGETTDFQRDVYFFSLLCSAAAAAMLIAPSSYHRIHFRQRSKEQLLLTSNRLSIAGLAFLAVAMTGVVLLITDVLFGGIVTVLVTTGTAIFFGIFWYGLPLKRRSEQ
jgi:uncharacterized protein DUF6328